jgi:hypothetical protein
MDEDEYVEDRSIWPQVIEVQRAVSEALAARRLGVQLTLLPGSINAILQNGIEDCAEGFVRMSGAFPYTSFPDPDVQPGCAVLYGATLEVGVMRCMAVEDPADQNSGPNFGQTFEAARIQMADMNAIRCGLLAADIEDIVIGQYVPVGPEGMAVGGFWQVTIGGA